MTQDLSYYADKKIIAEVNTPTGHRTLFGKVEKQQTGKKVTFIFKSNAGDYTSADIVEVKRTY